MPNPARLNPTPMSYEAYCRQYNESERHVELIDGQVYTMPPAGPRHVTTVSRMRRIIERQLDESLHMVREEKPITLPGDSAPEPDLAVVVGPEGRYEAKHPGAADVLLAIEVAETTLSYDRNKKLPLYAKHGIVEVWIVDLAARQVEVYRHPDIAARRYEDETNATSMATLQPTHVPAVSVPLSAVFPARP